MKPEADWEDAEMDKKTEDRTNANWEETESDLATYGTDELARVYAKHSAERIVSCVNNCAGINPEAIPDMVEVLKFVVTASPFDADGELVPAIRSAEKALEKAGVK